MDDLKPTYWLILSAAEFVVMGPWETVPIPQLFWMAHGVETGGLDSLYVSFFSYLLTIFYCWNYIFRSIFVSRSYPKLRLGVGIARVGITLVGIKRAPPTLSLVR